MLSNLRFKTKAATTGLVAAGLALLASPPAARAQAPPYSAAVTVDGKPLAVAFGGVSSVILNGETMVLILGGADIGLSPVINLTVPATGLPRKVVFNGQSAAKGWEVVYEFRQAKNIKLPLSMDNRRTLNATTGLCTTPGFTVEITRFDKAQKIVEGRFEGTVCELPDGPFHRLKGTFALPLSQ